MIADARIMFGLGLGADADDVRARWQAWADDKGFDPTLRGGEPGDRVHDLLTADDSAQAFVAQGRWVAICPTCGGGIATWAGMADACCLDCGTIRPVDHPDDETIDAAGGLLATRELSYQNFRPDRGESIVDLQAENAQNALPFAGNPPPTDDEQHVLADAMSQTRIDPAALALNFPNPDPPA